MLSSEFGAFFISNIVKVCSAIIAGRESLPRCWSVLLELMSVHEKAVMLTAGSCSQHP